MQSEVVYYVGRPEEVEHHAAALRPFCEIVTCEPESLPERVRPGNVCVFYNEFFARFRDCCLAVQRLGCPTLYAIDGILEWRNIWEFPSNLGACLWTMRPVLADKIACIGRSQARILESWGNLGKCEIVGVPRFDRLLGRTPRDPGDTPFRLLIMTAKAPGFTPDQIACARKSLADLKSWIDGYNLVNQRPIQPLWRVTAGLDAEIGVPNELRDTTGADLATVLGDVDAVMTTPSTAMLESMLHGLPVAVLDYTNSPQYVSAAWTVTCREHLDRVVAELMSPPESKRLHQRTLLHDHLECRTPAAPRMVTLIQEMHRRGRQSDGEASSPRYPRRILADPQDEHHIPEETFDLQRLFPDHAVFRDLDVAKLQAEVGHLRLELQRKSAELLPLIDMMQRLEANPLSRNLLWLRRQIYRWFQPAGRL